MIRPLHFPRNLLIVCLISMSGMVGLVAYVHYKHLTEQPYVPLIPTKKVDSSVAIGGQPNSQTPPFRPSSSHHDTSESYPSTSQQQQPAQPPTAPSSSKQDEVTASVKKEYAYTALVAPNDPYYASSWAMQHTSAAAAWNINTGTVVKVAVIDTGFALQHEDLTTQWAINTQETGMTQLSDHCWTGAPQDKSTNTCDDDDNGYVDDWRGWNFVNKTNNPQAGTTMTNGTAAISHGTSTAGLVSAATNNGKGIASYNWNAKIIPLEVLDDSGVGVTSSVIAAILYAVDNGAQVINLSFGGPDQDPALQPALDYAFNHGTVVVAAAGNCGTNGDAGCDGLTAPRMMYPALNNHVIAVGATDSNDSRASFSSYGPGIDVVAPGSGSIVSPLIDTRTTPYNYTSAYSGSLYGTSFAAPVVSSIAALIRSIRPLTTVDDITALIDGSATKVAKMNGQIYTNEYGHGLVSAGTALLIADNLTKNSTSTPIFTQTGDSRSEHSYSSTAAMSSGCKVSAGTYCTIRMENTTSYFDRYLPYQKADATGRTGWQWSGGILRSGEWSLRATQGDSSSGTYFLFAK